MGRRNGKRKWNLERGLTLVISLFLAFGILICAVYMRDITYFDSGESHAPDALWRFTGGTAVTSVSDTKQIQKRQELFLREKTAYPDMAAWVIVPGTVIDYPIMQTSDATDYSERRYDQESDIAGTPFIDVENAPDFSDFSTTVYAHGRYDDTMFSVLPELLQAERFEEIAQGILISDDGSYLLEFCACTKVQTAEELRVETLQDMEALIAQAQQQRPMTLTAEDHMVVFATLEEDTDGTDETVITALIAKIESN